MIAIRMRNNNWKVTFKSDMIKHMDLLKNCACIEYTRQADITIEGNLYLMIQNTLCSYICIESNIYFIV